MTEHSVLIKVIDNIENLRPANRKGDGCCFGATMTAAYATFHGILGEYVKAVKAVNEEFKDLLTEADIKQRIEAWENDSEKSQHLTWLRKIAIAQDPDQHLGEGLAQSGAAITQHGSIPLLLETFSCVAPNNSNSVNPMASAAFTAYCDFQKLESFFIGIRSKNVNQPIAFIISMMGHTIGCGYDHIRKSWFFTDGTLHSLIKQDMSTEDIVDFVWQSIKRDNDAPRVIFIEPIVPFSTSTSDCDREFYAFRKQEFERIRNYSKNVQLEMYITAFNFNDNATQDVMADARFINPLFKFHDNVRLLSSRDDLLMHALEHGYKDVALGCIWHEELPEFNKQNSNGETPLILTIKNEKIYLAQRITNIKGINVSLKDNAGKTALTYAEENNYTNLIDRIKALSPPEKLNEDQPPPQIETQKNLVLFSDTLEKPEIICDTNPSVLAGLQKYI